MSAGLFTRGLVLAVLPPADAPALSAAEIHAAIGVGSRGTVRDCLHRLAADGLAESFVEPLWGALTRRRWRQSAAA